MNRTVEPKEPSEMGIRRLSTLNNRVYRFRLVGMVSVHFVQVFRRSWLDRALRQPGMLNNRNFFFDKSTQNLISEMGAPYSFVDETTTFQFTLTKDRLV